MIRRLLSLIKVNFWNNNNNETKKKKKVLGCVYFIPPPSLPFALSVFPPLPRHSSTTARNFEKSFRLINEEKILFIFFFFKPNTAFIHSSEESERERERESSLKNIIESLQKKNTPYLFLSYSLSPLTIFNFRKKKIGHQYVVCSEGFSSGVHKWRCEYTLTVKKKNHKLFFFFFAWRWGRQI